MCLILLRKNANAPLPKNWAHAITNNPHGGGVLWWANRRWQAKRFGQDELDEFRRFIIDVAKQRTPIAIHFRLATSGPRTADCAHPFPAGHGTWLMHNGVIPIDHDWRAESDTAAFARLLTKLPSGWWNDRTYRELVGLATNGSRLALALPTKPYWITWGEWDEHQGWWHSNRQLIDPPKPKFLSWYGKDLERVQPWLLPSWASITED